MEFNPALYADDVADVYMLWRRSAQQKKQKVTKPEEKEPEKIAAPTMTNFFKAVGNFAIRPMTVGLTAAGLFNSMYGPPWAFGPGEDEKRWSGKRAMRSIVMWNTLGRGIANTPTAIKEVVTGVGKAAPESIRLSKDQRITSALFAAPALVAGAHLVNSARKNDEPDLEKTRGLFAKVGWGAIGAGTIHEISSQVLRGGN